MKIAPPLRELFNYLMEKGCLVQLDNYNPAYLPIFSRDVLQKIKVCDNTWTEAVPPEVADVIRKRGVLRLQKAGGEGAGGVRSWADVNMRGRRRLTRSTNDTKKIAFLCVHSVLCG